MRKVYLFVAGLCVIGWLAPSTALADKKNGPRYKFFEKYDKNKNGKIDDDEKEAIRKNYAANPEGDLKRFDKNKDGKLDDEEIAAIKPPTDKRKSDKGKTETTEKVGKSDKTEKSSSATGQTNQIEKSSGAAAKSATVEKSDKVEKKP